MFSFPNNEKKNKNKTKQEQDYAKCLRLLDEYNRCEPVNVESWEAKHKIFVQIRDLYVHYVETIGFYFNQKVPLCYVLQSGGVLVSRENFSLEAICENFFELLKRHKNRMTKSWDGKFSQYIVALKNKVGYASWMSEFEFDFKVLNSGKLFKPCRYCCIGFMEGIWLMIEKASGSISPLKKRNCPISPSLPPLRSNLPFSLPPPLSPPPPLPLPPCTRLVLYPRPTPVMLPAPIQFQPRLTCIPPPMPAQPKITLPPPPPPPPPKTTHEYRQEFERTLCQQSRRIELVSLISKHEKEIEGWKTEIARLGTLEALVEKHEKLVAGYRSQINLLDADLAKTKELAKLVLGL